MFCSYSLRKDDRQQLKLNHGRPPSTGLFLPPGSNPTRTPAQTLHAWRDLPRPPNLIQVFSQPLML